MRLAIAITAAFLSSGTIAQTIYRCGNSYSETPCPDAKSVDIVPTDGAHSMSGRMRMSVESNNRQMLREIDRGMEKAVGMKEGAMTAERERIKQADRAKKNAPPNGSIEWGKK